MKVFISWSGDQSLQVASILKDWLPTVIQALDPWISTQDIDKGESWFQKISESLVNGDGVGVFCLTPGNLASPWIAFEAGVLAGQEQGRVMTFLHRLTATEVKYPLGLFQATNSAVKEDVHLLLKSLNTRCSVPLKDDRFQRAFDQNWPALKNSLENIADVPMKPQQKDPDTPGLLNEILAVVRRIEKDGQVLVPRNIENLGFGGSGGIINGGVAAHIAKAGLFGDASVGALTKVALDNEFRKPTLTKTSET